MKILLIAGASDLAQVLSPQLVQNNHDVFRLDIRKPKDNVGIFIDASILDRKALNYEDAVIMNLLE
jgi:hypothetical protein